VEGRWDWDVARARCLREAQRVLRSRAEAEDAVQNALLRAWRSRDSCRTPEAPLPWLLQITRNEALRLLRQNGRAEVPGGLPDEPAQDDPAVASVPDRVDVGRVLAGLSNDDRRLFELRYTNDLTQPAVAAELGVPVGTVKVRLHRLRSRLRFALEAEV
jgi:RNA polymerase sigma-70 factor (ECF subfamily)